MVRKCIDGWFKEWHPVGTLSLSIKAIDVARDQLFRRLLLFGEGAAVNHMLQNHI